MSLRTAAIRLAYANPELRSVLLPLLGSSRSAATALGLTFQTVPKREIDALKARLMTLFTTALQDAAPEPSMGLEDLQEDMAEERFATNLAYTALIALFPGGIMDEQTKKPVGWKPLGPVKNEPSLHKMYAAYTRAAGRDPKVRALVKAIHAAYVGE